MDPECRKFLQAKRKELVDGTKDIDEVIKQLRRKKVLNDRMIKDNEMKGDKEERCHHLYKLLEKRGPDAFLNLYDTFMELKYYDLAGLLKTFLTKDVIIEMSNERRDHNPNKMYKMSSNPRGYMLLINIKRYESDVYSERHASEKDEIKVFHLWQNLGYKVFAYRDLKLKEFQNVVIEFSKMEELKKMDSIVIFIMTHGVQNPTKYREVELRTATGSTVNSEWIMEQFNSWNCPYMNNKPKLFFFQTCRGDIRNYGISTDGDIRDLCLKDALIVYATVPGTASIRDPERGTFFVQSMFSVFKKNVHRDDLITLLEQVNLDIKTSYPTSVGYNIINKQNRFFSKLLYFNPGIYE